MKVALWGRGWGGDYKTRQIPGLMQETEAGHAGGLTARWLAGLEQGEGKGCPEDRAGSRGSGLWAKEATQGSRAGRLGCQGQTGGAWEKQAIESVGLEYTRGKMQLWLRKDYRTSFCIFFFFFFLRSFLYNVCALLL